MSEQKDSAAASRFTWIIVAYLVAVALAVALLWWLARADATLSFEFASRALLVNAALADVLATLVIFAFSLAFRNSSFYDAYWSVIPPLLLGYWWWFGTSLAGGAQLRYLLMTLLVVWWSVRLTHNWARGWHGLADEDWRYRDLQASLGIFYWPVSLLGVHLFPTVWVFLGCLGLYAASGSALVDMGATVAGQQVAGLGLLDLLAVLVGGSAVWIEMRADTQLRQFRQQRESSAELLRTGVWAWCRHPNYLGEIGFWLALAMFGAAALPAAWWVWLGPLSMLLLFVGISIRMIETKLALVKPDYASYQADTPMLLPRPWSR